MKKVIVSGANGFIGNSTVKELLKNDIEVLALCHKLPKDKLISELIMYKEFELSNINEFVNTISHNYYDTFYHFAWLGSDVSDRANSKLQLQNVEWTLEAIRLAKQLGCKRFICAGSIMEHEVISATYTDGNKPGSAFIYGSAKMTAHTMASSVATSIGIDLIWAEVTNAYGVGEISNRLVNSTIRKVIKGESPQFTAGTQNYDFIYIDDVAKAFYLIGKNGKPFHSYLIGSGNARPLKEWLLEMKKAIAPDIDFIFGNVPFTGINLDLSIFDTTKTTNHTGFKAEIPFSEGVKKTLTYLKDVGQ